jgi:uncharacterized membrane-anchored protein YhcB (DUF1043 family)
VQMHCKPFANVCKRCTNALQTLCKHCANAVQTLCKRFAFASQTLRKRFANAVQTLRKCFANALQTLCKHCANAAQTLVRNFKRKRCANATESQQNRYATPRRLAIATRSLCEIPVERTTPQRITSTHHIPHPEHVMKRLRNVVNPVASSHTA